ATVSSPYRSGGSPAGDAARKQTTAEKCALEGAITVHAAAAETGDFAGGVYVFQRFAVGLQYARGKIGFNAAQRLPGEHPKPHGDQRAGGGVEQAVGLGDANEAVTDIIPRFADRA